MFSDVALPRVRPVAPVHHCFFAVHGLLAREGRRAGVGNANIKHWPRRSKQRGCDRRRARRRDRPPRSAVGNRGADRVRTAIAAQRSLSKPAIPPLAHTRARREGARKVAAMKFAVCTTLS